MFKDAVAPLGGAVLSIFVITLSALVLTDPSAKYNPSGRKFASTQLALGCAGFLISFVFTVLWWRKKKEDHHDPQNYDGPEATMQSPNCCYIFFGFFVAICILALSSLILSSENKTAESSGSVDPSAIYLFAAITVSVATLGIILFGTRLALWAFRKYQA